MKANGLQKFRCQSKKLPVKKLYERKNEIDAIAIIMVIIFVCAIYDGRMDV